MKKNWQNVKYVSYFRNYMYLKSYLNQECNLNGLIKYENILGNHEHENLVIFLVNLTQFDAGSFATWSNDTINLGIDSIISLKWFSCLIIDSNISNFSLFWGLV